MTTTSQQMDDFATLIENSTSWNIQMNRDLYALIDAPSRFIQGRTLPPPSINCFDSLLPWRPVNWLRTSMGEVPNVVGRKAHCTLSLWENGGLKMEVYPLQLCYSMTLALVVATARAWQFVILKQQEALNV